MSRDLSEGGSVTMQPWSLNTKICWLFRACALINWSVSIRGIIDPAGYLAAFGGAEPEYEFVFRLWSGFIFMFGCMFWEVSRDVAEKAALIKYNWIEKTITALAVTGGYFLSDVPTRMMIVVALTNLGWIPILLYYDLRLRAALREHGSASGA